MNAQQILLDYASKANDTTLTDAQFLGQAATEGVAINRQAGNYTVVRMSRSGKTISITETARWDGINGKEEKTETVLTVEL